MNDKISVVIPVYKVEKYLNKCIDSIINQTYKNIEIILIDDGSPDKCGEICDYYAKKDKRIKVIHKENGGLSSARNEGLKIVNGNWVVFIDSDDYVKEDYLEYLLNLVKNNSSDIGIVMPYEVDESYIENKKHPNERIEVMDNLVALKTMLYQKKFDTSAWGKIFSIDIVRNIEFPLGKLYEDIGTIYKYILNSKKVVYSNQMKYYYLIRSDSIMGSPFKINDMDYVEQASILMNDISKMNNIDLFKAAKCRFLNTNFSIIMKIRSKEYLKEKTVLISNIKKYRKEVLFDKNSRFKTKIAILLSYLNYFR